MGLLEAAVRYRQLEPVAGVEITEEYREVFVVEAREHLDEWESGLLELENRPDDEGLINQIFRAIHTLKGSAGFIGFEGLQRLAHDLESTLQSVRDGEQPLTATRTDFLFRGLDMSKRMVEAFADGKNAGEDVNGFLRALSEAEGDGSPSDRGASPESASSRAHSTGSREVGLPPAQNFSSSAAADTLSGAPGVSAEGSRRFAIQVFVDSTGREAFLRAFLLRSRIASVASILSEDPAPETLKDSTGRFEYTLTVLTDKEESELRAAANIDQIELRSITQEAQVPPAAAQSPAPVSAQGTSEHQGTNGDKQSRHDEVVRVSVERLDNLLNLVGELVVQNSNFTSLSEEMAGEYGRGNVVLKMQERTENLAKITRDLQDGIMKVRMLPVNTVFMRFHRVVRDLARASGKEVTLDIFGGETEIDKKVIDRIGDPLVHLIRNAVDHGIETKEQRAALGKPPMSTVRLGAFQDGDHICIEVSDDGRGLDRDAILKKARAKGLINEDDANLTENRILDLIFQPGFSTAERITDVSGRGVGMDVVKQGIESLGGSVRIRSELRKGTTVTITLPLTMAIIRAVLVEVEDLTVAIPLSAVKEVLKVSNDELQSVGLRQVIRLREEVLAVVQMREVLTLARKAASDDSDRRSTIIVVDYDGRKIGLGVDRVMGTHEIVIKSLSRHYKEVEGFIGATILGDGRIALIVDVEAIVHQFHAEITETNGSPVKRRPGRNRSSKPVEAPAGEQLPPPADGLSKAGEGLPSESVDSADGIRELYERASEVLTQVGSSGALRASMALSQLTGVEVRVGFPESELVELPMIADILGGEEAQIAGIYIGVTGAISGGILIGIPVDQVAEINRYLLGRNGHNGDSGETVDMSAISEFGNMLSASFINAIGDETEMLTQIEPPEISVDLCLAVLDSVVARFNSAGNNILLLRAVVMFGEEEQIGCNLLLFLEPKSLERLLSAFAAVVA